VSLAVIKRVFWIGVGYVAAIVAATSICVTINPLLAGIWPSAGATFLLILTASPVFGLRALPLAGLAIIASELTILRTWLYFALVGIVIGHVVASGFEVRLFDREGSLDYDYLTALAAAFIAGTVFWQVTRRRTGK
jgi:hypothetical protein